MKTFVKTEGFKELDDALGQFSKATARNVLRRALIKAGEPIAAKARLLAPDDPDGPADDVKNSITVSVRTANKVGKAAYASAKHSGKTDAEAVDAMRSAQRHAKGRGSFAEVDVGPSAGRNARVGILQEFGTSHHPPHPFMRPAWAAHKHDALVLISQHLGEEIEKAAARAAKKKPKGR